MPNQWNKAIVYPIPKPGDWELNLAKIRPITLLKIPRKILMKLLTNRLSTKLSVNSNILKDHNYAGLSGKSTLGMLTVWSGPVLVWSLSVRGPMTVLRSDRTGPIGPRSYGSVL